jgi:hypothetical protein
MNAVLQKEFPYQVVMVAVILELLILAALMPRGFGAEPLAYSMIASLRLGALLACAFALRGTPPRLALAALTLWSLFLLPPELWSYALEARAGLPTTALTSLMMACGAYSSARHSPILAFAFVGVVIGALFWTGFTLNASSSIWIVLAALSLLLTLALHWKRS